MSIGQAVQRAVYGLLVADAGVGALVGDRIYDRPYAPAAYPYLRLGPGEFVLPPDDACAQARLVTLQIDSFSTDKAGVYETWAIVDAVRAALHLAEPVLDAGALIEMRVVQARVIPDPRPEISHGVVTLSLEVEE